MVLIFDGLNLMHRAKIALGQDSKWGVVFATIRSIRSLIHKKKPDEVYFVLEGKPKRRIEQSEGTYKAGRAESADTFWAQCTDVVQLMKDYFPIKIVRHLDYEADDVIAYLATEISKHSEVEIVSTDTDFIQLLTTSNPNIKLYSPIKDVYVEPHPVDYVTWKALRGDKTDNIQGIPGIGDKRAQKMIEENKLHTLTEEQAQIFEHNKSMIRFESIENLSNLDIQYCTKRKNDELRQLLREKYDFQSMTSDKSWFNWIGSFNKPWMCLLNK